MKEIRKQLRNEFLGDTGWGKADCSFLSGDASFRKYYRVSYNNKTAILMDAPPEKENISSFIKIAKHLRDNNLKSPIIIADDIQNGFLLLEDFGDNRFNLALKYNLRTEDKLYKDAIDVLIKLHKIPCPNWLKEYSTDLLLNEIKLFTEYYLPWLMDSKKISLDKNAADDFINIWKDILSTANFNNSYITLRDYHADNLMLLDNNTGIDAVGLLDFQDAVIGSATYDLVSLLEDVRRDVGGDKETESSAFANTMLVYYQSQMPDMNIKKLKQDYAILGAQRNIKILGIFVRLLIRDGKDNYLEFLPRTLKYLKRDLQHPALNKLSLWFAINLPDLGISNAE